MRARRLRPIFDSLDTRLVLDGGTAVSAVAAVAPPADTSSATSSDSGNLIDIVDWYLPGNPPGTPYVPDQPPIPYDLMPTS